MSNPEVLNVQSKDQIHALSLLEGDAVHSPERWVDEIEMKFDGSSFSQLHFSELLVGHQDSASDYLDYMVDTVKELPDKPDVIITGALLQGPFKHIQKPRRVTLEQGLETLDAQLRVARTKIDRLLEIGAPVVYNLGPDDHRISEDMTIEMMRKMLKMGKDLSVDQTNQVKGHPRYQEHLDFQNRVVFPYMLHSGRRLKTANEVQIEGVRPEDEYFTLWTAHQRRLAGTRPTRREQKLLDMKAFDNKDFTVTDGVDIVSYTENGEWRDKVRSYMGFSPEPQYQDHLKPSVNYMQDRATHGEQDTNVMVQHNHEFVAMGFGEAWLTSNGSGIDARNFMDTRGHRSDARGDISRRLNTTRRRVHPPMGHIISRHDNGNTEFTLLGEKLTEKSDSLGRTAILFTCDHQIGSITARPDVLLKEIDYFRSRAADFDSTAIQFAGDMSHGRNYPDFASESQSTGLMSMDSQIRFQLDLWKGALGDMSKEEWDAIESIVVQPGNHEWNSGTDKWHGYSFVDDLKAAFETMLARSGYTDEQIAQKVRTFDAIATKKGEIAKAYTAVTEFGDYKMLNQHFLLARGGKGSGGAAPIYQADAYMKGLADNGADIDLLGVGHWHHPSCACFGNKAAWTAPAKAGLSGYEIWRGYRPQIGSLMVKLGGGLPVELEFISERALNEHVITKGRFAQDKLEDEGYQDHPEHDPAKHGLRGSRLIPRSALQQAVRDLEDDVSNRVDTTARF